MIVLGVMTVVMLAATLAGLAVFDLKIDNYFDFAKESSETFSRNYFYITDKKDENLQNSIYEKMTAYALSADACVELAGEGLSTEYSKGDLMKIAINAGADGIILEADDSEDTKNLINEAAEKGIPVVTVLTDSPSAERKSYVGISYYTLGIEYGKLVMQVYDDMSEARSLRNSARVMILLDKTPADTYQNILFSAISESIAAAGPKYSQIEIYSTTVENDSLFSAEEAVRDMLKESESVPDIIISLNEHNTRSVYQCLVDTNRVGKTTIIGYYDSDTILRAIEKKGIYATVTVDTEQMAKYCIDALNEYAEYGRVSEYYGVDYTLITEENVSLFLDRD